MSSTPIKNGVIVRFTEYGNRYLRADIYKVGNAYVFVGSEFYQNDDAIHDKIDVDVTLHGNTIERDSNGYKLIIVERSNCLFRNTEIMEHPE